MDVKRDRGSPRDLTIYNETDVVLNRPQNTFFHCVHVQGDPQTRGVLGYVEYFGYLRLVVMLSNAYSGRAFSECYAVDPVAGLELSLVLAAVRPAHVAAVDGWRTLARRQDQVALRQIRTGPDFSDGYKVGMVGYLTCRSGAGLRRRRSDRLNLSLRVTARNCYG